MTNQIKKFSDFNLKAEIQNFVGDKISVSRLIDKEIIVRDYKIVPSKIEGCDKCVHIQIEYKEDLQVVFTGGKYLIQILEKIPKTDLPFLTKIIKPGEHYEFA